MQITLIISCLVIGRKRLRYDLSFQYLGDIYKHLFCLVHDSAFGSVSWKLVGERFAALLLYLLDRKHAAFDYLLKPVDEIELVTVISKLDHCLSKEEINENYRKRWALRKIKKIKGYKRH